MNPDPQALAAQLRQPSGENGIAVAQLMHETNIGMTQHAINQLNLQKNQRVLELGHGNAAHLPQLFEKASNLLYTGLETSTLMQQQASAINRDFVNQNTASFHVYDGTNIPFEDETFDRIFSVNTLYFWENPVKLLSELARVLQTDGQLNLTFAQKDFMAQLPFTFGFELYDTQQFQELVNQSDFIIRDMASQTEWVQSKTGQTVQREFITASLIKKTT